MKTLLLLICIIATLGLQVPAAKVKLVNPIKQLMATSVCAGKNGVMVSMPGSCSGFFFCVDGNAIASSCGSFYHFNSELSMCDHPDKAGCKDPAATSEVPNDAAANDVCSQAPDGYKFGKALSCNLFYVCDQKQAVRRVCPPQKHFNSTTRICQEVEKSQCIFTTPSLENVKLKAKPVSLPVSGIGASLRNPVKAKKPLHTEISKTTFTPASLCSSFVDTRTVPHPWDCSKFIFCLSHNPLVMTCPKGLHFNTKNMRCEWPNIAKCKVHV